MTLAATHLPTLRTNQVRFNIVFRRAVWAHDQHENAILKKVTGFIRYLSWLMNHEPSQFKQRKN
jgi:hypothetical protein